MIKILVIAYMFPPLAGGGTQRPLKFVKYLPHYGITPVVFCPHEAVWKTYDATLLDLPFLREVKIYRKGIRSLRRYYHLRYEKGYQFHPYFYLIGIRFLFHLDIFSAWYFECRQAVLKIIKEEKIDCVLTTSPPHSSHLFGQFIKKHAGIPWLMDIRDTMVDDPNLPASLVSQLQAPLRLWYEKKFFSSADAIISVSDPIIESIDSRHGSLKLASKLSTITNGFDDDDFAHIPLDQRSREHMRITYTGSFMGKQTPQTFLEAIALLVKKNAIDPNDLRLRFIGDFDENVQHIFNRFSKQIPIEIEDFQPYEKALYHQANSDLLLLIVSTDTKKEGANQTMTGKFFEYIGAQRPIFALVPGGPLKVTIDKGGFGISVPPKCIHQIAKIFKKIYDQWKFEGRIQYHPDIKLRANFSRKRLTGKLASIVNSLNI